MQGNEGTKLESNDPTSNDKRLLPQHPHCPSGHQHSAQKHREAIESVAHHVARGLAVSNPEYDRSEQRKHRRRAEMIECDGHRADLHEEVLADALCPPPHVW